MPAASTLRLVDPATGNELLSLGPWTATVLTKLDPGYPSVRSTTTVKAGGHGVTDTTRWTGDRAIVAEVVLPAGPDADTALDALGGLLNPELRLYAYMQRPGWAQERRTLVTGRSLACPPGVMRTAQLGWSAPSGLLEDATATTINLAPSGSGTGGMSFPVTFPMTFGSGFVAGAAQVTVGGNVAAPVIARIYGPCSDPIVRCVSTGEQVSFPGLTIAATDYLEVNTATRSAYLNGDINQSRYSRLDFTTSTWWRLPVGSAVGVVFSATSTSGNSQCALWWRSTWL